MLKILGIIVWESAEERKARKKAEDEKLRRKTHNAGVEFWGELFGCSKEDIEYQKKYDQYLHEGRLK